MKNNLLLYGAVAVGAYLIYKKMQDNKNNPTGREIAPPPVSNTKPAPRSLPAQGRVNRDFVCPTKEQMARSRYTKEGMDYLREMGCLNN
jgi:hypothetical protein